MPLVFLQMFACASEVAVGVPWLEAPPLVELDDAIVGRVVTWGVEVTNTGTEDALVSLSATGAFEVPEEAPVVVPAGATVPLTVLLIAPSYEPVLGSLSANTGFQEIDIQLLARVTADADADGHRASGAGGTDCADDDAERNPDRVEVCNGVDDDCSGRIDDVDDPPRWFPDADGDGFGDASAPPVPSCDAPAAHVMDAADCDDSNPGIHPNAVEVWYDGVDSDCDGAPDFDRDRDGHDHDAHGGTDCDDADPGVNPSALEVWYDGVDQDCDGNDLDQDYDGVSVLQDCDDLDPFTFPGAPELDDGVDQDCDGLLDEDFLVGGSLLFTELMADPRAVPDADGRYVELHNPTDGHVVLAGVTVSIGPDSTTLPAGMLPPSGVLVLCVNVDPARNGGLVCSGFLTWNSGTRLALTAPDGLVLDVLDIQGWAMPAGAALELAADHLDPDANDDETSWCPAAVDLGSGDLGTPGAITPPCP